MLGRGSTRNINIYIYIYGSVRLIRRDRTFAQKVQNNTSTEPNKSMRHMLILLGLQWGLQGVPGDSPAVIYRFVGCFKTLFEGCVFADGDSLGSKGYCWL